MRNGSMAPRLARGRGLLVLALWQTPLPVHSDPTSPLRIGFGLGAGAFEQVVLDCSGDVVESSRVGFETIGGGVEAWPDEHWRVSGSAAAARTDSAGTRAIASTLVAHERSWFGVGLGIGTFAPGDDLGVYPAAYLRGGPLDRLHVRAEVGTQDVVPGTGGVARLGIGYNRGARAGWAGEAGLAACHFCEADRDGYGVGFYSRMRVPIRPGFDLELRALLGPGERHPNWGLAAVTSFELGGATSATAGHR